MKKIQCPNIEIGENVHKHYCQCCEGKQHVPFSVALKYNLRGLLVLTDDGKFVPVFYKTDENYEPIKKNGAYIVDPTRTNVLSQDAMKLALGGKTGVKQLNKEMGKPSKQQKVTVKKGDLDDL